MSFFTSGESGWAGFLDDDFLEDVLRPLDEDRELRGFELREGE
jgi:hypothetical protein